MNNVTVKTYSLSAVNMQDVLRYAGCKSRDENVETQILQCANEIKDVLSPRVCFTYLPAQTIRDTFPKSKLVELRLKDCEQAVVFVATVGLEIDRLILKNQTLSPTKALLLQSLGAERIENLCDSFCAELQNAAYRFSPGYGDFPLQAQEWIFQTLNATKRIGVTLNTGLLMTPTKSVSAIVPIKG